MQPWKIILPCLLLGTISLPGLLSGRPVLAADPPEPLRPRREKAARTRFYVIASRGPENEMAAAFCESMVRMVGTAHLVHSERDADYILAPTAKINSRLSYSSHYKTVETVYFEKGERKTKKEQKRTHSDDVLNVTTNFVCHIARVTRDGDPRDVLIISGGSSRATPGTNTSGHDADDLPINLRRFEVERLEREYGALEHNSGRALLLRSITDLCRAYGNVTRVDAQANRLTIDLGGDDGIHTSEDEEGVSEMEIYAQTGKLAAYIFQEPVTGWLYRVDPKSAEDGDNRENWVYQRIDTTSGEKKVNVQGAEASRLVPLGERASVWAEVQEVHGDHCIAALKRKGDFGRTVDDRTAVEKLPDPQQTPIIARVRVKRGHTNEKLSK